MVPSLSMVDATEFPNLTLLLKYDVVPIASPAFKLSHVQAKLG